MKVTGMNRTTEQRNLLRIYSIDKKENVDPVLDIQFLSEAYYKHSISRHLEIQTQTL